jgi:hypothetical protein
MNAFDVVSGNAVLPLPVTVWHAVRDRAERPARTI